MNDFYLFKSGTIRKKNGTVVLESEEETTIIPIEQIRSLYIFGEVTINKRLLELLSHYQITMHFFNYYGTLVGSYSPENRRPVGEILFNQVSALKNESHRHRIAAAIQHYSLKNSLALLKYYHKRGIDLSLQIGKIEEILDEIDHTSHIEDVLLCEARAKKIYYSGFDLILKDTPFEFEKRTVLPPENEVNSLMSFGYYLLYGVILTELNISRLYAELPFIHSDIRSGHGLQYDLADIYKPIFVDRLFIGLIRRHSIQKDDFERRENQGIYLSEKGKKKYVSEFNDMLQRKVHYGNRERSYRSVIQHDIHRIIHHLECPEEPLILYLHEW